MNGVCAIINETKKRVLFFKEGASGAERMGKAVSFWDKNKKLILEFLRYVVVGGVSAVVDMAVNYLMLYVVFQGTKDDHGLVAVSVAVGFAVGLIANFVLSNLFVFKEAEQKEKGQTVGAFLIYVAVGVIGFGMTEGLTLLGTRFIGDTGLWYLLLTCVVKGIVLIWNYVGRKIFVYKGK
ncbi:MAG: GtrA family protein [Clostridia bacterium]|nr:GtrA family protein [Clostridia bacterium]